tara:strand:+ start:166 stop:396 length:231 start_codon:yes stop_codon:yes gene_type:complete
MENILGKIMILMSEEIDKNKENKSNDSLEYRLGKNDAYSTVLTMMNKAMVAEHKESSKRIDRNLMDDKKNNSEWKD